MAIPPEIIEAVRERTSIVEIISESVALKPSGRNHLGLCPFHREKTPSFNVREEEGTFHCFGCGKHGSVFNFVMETRGLSFPEAVSFLANRIGIKIPERGSWKRDDAESARRRERQKLLRAIVAVASSVYGDALWLDERGAGARNYLAKRGISEQTARRFMLGVAPAGWEFITAAVRERLERHPSALLSPLLATEGRLEELLLDAGLIKQRREQQEARAGRATGGYDTFRDRLMFTIARSDGAPIAFGGRDMSGSANCPKYINSPETPVYLKRKTLYGLSQALPAIRSERHVYLVEGYFDVLSMFQRGFENTVACCGTALAPEHVGILKRFVDRTTVVFDGDSAGRKAAANCAEVFINSNIDVSVVILDESEDPDSICRQMERDQVAQLYRQREQKLADVFVNYQFERLNEKPENAGSVARGKVGSAFASLAARVINSVEREALIRRGAEQIGISFASLEELVAAQKKGGRGGPAAAARGSERAEPSQADPGEPPEWLREASSAPRAASSADRRSKRAPRESIAGAERAPWWRDLLVAGIVQPALAGRLLGLLEKCEAVLPDNVRQALQDVISSGLRQDSDWQEIAALLSGNKLEPSAFEIHVSRARAVGGAKFDRLLETVADDAARSSLREELSRLQAEELQAADEQMLQRLVQEKLARKRDMALIGRRQREEDKI